jgi:hypothetical protein
MGATAVFTSNPPVITEAQPFTFTITVVLLTIEVFKHPTGLEFTLNIENTVVELTIGVINEAVPETGITTVAKVVLTLFLTKTVAPGVPVIVKVVVFPGQIVVPPDIAAVGCATGVIITDFVNVQETLVVNIMSSNAKSFPAGKIFLLNNSIEANVLAPEFQV